MKRVSISFLFLMIILGFVNAEEPDGNELTVHVKGIEGTQGQIAIGLYDSKDNWKGEPFLGSYVIISGDTVSYTFENVPPGTYAVALYHDENMNKKLDTGLFKIPKEGYAFSNNVFGTFGRPKFKNASFLLTGKKELQIKIKY